MTNDDFQNLFGADADELAAAAAAVEAEVAAEAAAAKAAADAEKPAKDGLWFSHNEDDANGHTISVYVVRMGGKIVLRALVDTALTVEMPGLPAGITAHPITITTGAPNLLPPIATKGFGLMAPHQDGTGTHIDGQSVRAYVVPRIARFLGQMYGV